MRSQLLGLILLIQWTGFYFLERPDPSSGGGLLISMLGYFANAVENGGPIFFLALAMWVARRAGSFDLSVASQAAVIACLATFLPGGPVFWATALPAALAAAGVMGWINKAAITRIPLPAVAVTLITLAAFRAAAWGIGTAGTGGPFLSIPGYEIAHRFLPLLLAAALVYALVGIGCRAWPSMRAGPALPRSKSHPPEGRRIGGAHVLAAALCIPAAVTYTAREGTADWAAMAGLEVEALAVLLIAGVASPLGRSLRACFLAALNLAVFAEGMISLGIALGEWYPSMSISTLGAIVFCTRYGVLLALAACLWGRQRTVGAQKRPATEIPPQAES